MSVVTPLAFETAFDAAFAAFWGSTTPIASENSKFDTTKAFERAGDNLAATSDDDAWVEVSLSFVDQQPVNQSINGAGTFRRNMVALVSIYTREGKGTGRSSTLLDDVVRFFERANAIPNAIVQNIEPVTIGTNGIWFQRSVSADLFYFTDRPA